MHDAMVTFSGWVGGEVAYRTTPKGNVANFRVGCTPRIKRDGDWVDGPTSWFSVSCWRGLADHVRDSVHKGDPVVVHGRLRTDVWERADGKPSVTFVVDAVYVGHDLNRGVATFHRARRPGGSEVEDEGDDVVKQAMHPQPTNGAQFDVNGNQRLAPEPGRVA